MNTGWFKKYGWIYIPLNGMGWLITLAALVFLVPVYLAVLRNLHSVPDDFVPTICVYQLYCFLVETDC